MMFLCFSRMFLSSLNKRINDMRNEFITYNNTIGHVLSCLIDIIYHITRYCLSVIDFLYLTNVLYQNCSVLPGIFGFSWYPTQQTKRATASQSTNIFIVWTKSAFMYRYWWYSLFNLSLRKRISEKQPHVVQNCCIILFKTR